MTSELAAAIVAATSMMYVRILVVSSIFNAGLGRMLVIPLLALASFGVILTLAFARSAKPSARTRDFSNPLQIPTALLFALIFVAVSMLATLAQTHFGRSGVFVLAGIVGIGDVDPFVLSLAQGGAAGIGIGTAAGAIVIAASSNNLLKAIYTLGFSRGKGPVPAAMLALLAVAGVVGAILLMR
jgi:uncharacterized membrane protein (DUF4010 family)